HYIGMIEYFGLERISYILDYLKNLNFPFNVVAHNIILNEYFKNNQFEEAMDHFESMKEEGISYDIYTYSIITKILLEEGKIDQALQLYEELKSSQIEPNLIFYKPFMKKLVEFQKY